LKTRGRSAERKAQWRGPRPDDRITNRPARSGGIGDPDKPIRIVVESISSRRRDQLADVEAEDGEVLDVTDEA
jgi:hypothetical protein